ncbi:MAG TPA: DinB family protein [Flavisolibacter sp.]|nr:DinB family protein [Flavisolibacter sp.]
MDQEIQYIIKQLTEVYEGEAWYGRPLQQLLDSVQADTVFEKPAGQHAIIDILWHMITWREFTIDRLQHSPQMTLAYFENNDWRRLDRTDKDLWPQGRERLQETQDQLLSLLRQTDDALLAKQVRERNYDFRKLLHGVIQHDIYHIGQIAFISKLLRGASQ